MNLHSEVTPGAKGRRQAGDQEAGHEERTPSADPLKKGIAQAMEEKKVKMTQ